jgi:hypothetical protein
MRASKETRRPLSIVHGLLWTAALAVLLVADLLTAGQPVAGATRRSDADGRPRSSGSAAVAPGPFERSDTITEKSRG